MKYHSRLLRLNLNNNQIESIEPLANLKILTILLANNNKIKNINSIENLILLKHVEMNDNHIENIEYIKKLKLIIILQFRNNKINHIPVGLFNDFEFLIHFDFGSNNIKCLDTIGSSKIADGVNTIRLNRNLLTSLSFLENFTSLIDLNVSENQIKHFTLYSVTNLINVDISFNPIENIYIGRNVRYLFIDLNLIEMFDDVQNERIVKITDKYVFLKSLYVVLNDQKNNGLNYVDCKLQRKLLVQRIFLNLLFSFQIENYLMNCSLELDF